MSLSSIIFCQDIKCESTIDYGNNAEHGNYASVNGIKMYYETYGDKKNQPLLLIHGNGGSVKYARCQIEAFKEDYYVIITDSRAQGKSEMGSQELNYRLMTSDYNELLNHLNLESVDIIGQSDGGIIGLLLAIEYPEKVHKLITVAPNLRADTTAFYDFNLEDKMAKVKAIEAEIAKGENIEELKKKKALTELMIKYPNISLEELKTIEAPTLVIFGDSDYMTFQHMEEIYKNIPKAHLFVVPGAGHRAYRLEPEIFNMMCKRFLENPFTRPNARDGY